MRVRRIVVIIRISPPPTEIFTDVKNVTTINILLFIYIPLPIVRWRSRRSTHGIVGKNNPGKRRDHRPKEIGHGQLK